MSKLVFKWMYWSHEWLGLVLGVFLLILGLTGSFLALLPQLEAFENPRLNVVAPSSRWVPPGKAIEAVAKTYPHYRLLMLLLPTSPTLPYKLYVLNAQDELFHVSVNEYSGEVLGILPDKRRFSGWIGDLHAHLFIGLWGSVVGAVLSILLVVSIITGFYVHLVMPRPMFDKRRTRKSLRMQLSDWHRVISLASLALNLVLAISAAFLGFERLPAAMAQKKTSVPRLSQSDMFLPPLPLDVYLRRASEVFPEKEPEIVTFPPLPGAPLSVLTREPYRKFFRTYSQVTFNAKTGAVIKTFDALSSGYRPKLHGVMLALHIGDFGGLPVRIIYCIIGLTPGVLCITGFIMWIKRRALFANAKPSFNADGSEVRQFELLS